MKYVVQQKLVAFGDDFSVYDESGNLAYYFDGKVFAFGKKIIVQNASGKEIARIRRKFFTFRPTFTVTRDRAVIAHIFKRLFTLKKGFTIDVPGPDDITVVGEMFEHNYHFHRNGQRIATVTKQWFKGQDTYGVDVNRSDDTLLVLSATIIIDLLCHPKRDSSFKTSK